MKKEYSIPLLPLGYDMETKTVLKQLNRSNMRLAELKGIAHTIPNEQILISTLTLQEAMDSSKIENIVTTQDDLYKAGLCVGNHAMNAAAKEVLAYREALQTGFQRVREKRLLSINTIMQIQSALVNNSAGIRTLPGTRLENATGEVVYNPPQDSGQIIMYLNNLEQFINDDTMCDVDPLVKLAIIHHQFESIHPFYDGNGRTGRIVNVLYLVLAGLLDLPILYLSRYIIHNKGRYYHALQAVRDHDGDNAREWEAWILFILKGIEETAADTIRLINGMARLMSHYKMVLRPLFGRQYKHELINNLFFHPYTKIEFVERDMLVKRKTAAKYLDMIVNEGLLEKKRIGNTNYYINTALVNLFVFNGQPPVNGSQNKTSDKTRENDGDNADV